MSKELETAGELPPFPKYLAYVMQSNPSDEPIRLSTLKERGKLGMERQDKDRILKVVNYLSLLKITHRIHQNLSHTPQPHIAAELKPSLAALIYYLYDEVCVREPKEPAAISFGEVYKNVVPVMPEVRAKILSQSDVIAQYPAIESNISDPQMPPNPESQLLRVFQRFNPAPYMRSAGF